VRVGLRKIPRRTFQAAALRAGAARDRPTSSHEPGRPLLKERGPIFDQHIYEMRPMTTDVNTTQSALQEFRTKAKDDIFGQDAAIDALADELGRCFENRSGNRSPGVFVLTGPDLSETKMELAHMLAAALGAAGKIYDLSPPWGGEDALILGLKPTLPHTMSLQHHLHDSPRSVILIHAIDLAHPTIVNRLMSAWTSGRLLGPSGEEISTREAIFILTTELAQGEIGELARKVIDPDRLHVSAVKVLADAGFPIPVLRSIDAVVCLKRLTAGELTRDYCKDLEEQVRAQGLVLDEGGLDARLVTYGLEPAIGAYTQGENALKERLDADLARVKDDGAKRVRLVLGKERILVLPVDQPLKEPASAPGSADQEGSGDE
jgi:ATP-dependent Clp protease ATP-binding subunit ClpA